MPNQHPRKAKGLTLSPEDFAFKRRAFHLAMVQLAATTDELRSMATDANPTKVIRAAKIVSRHESRALDLLLTLADLDPADPTARTAYTEALHTQIAKTVRGTHTLTQAVDTLVRRPTQEQP